MDVDLKVVFKQEDLEQLCIERCRSLKPAIVGHFEAKASNNYYSPAVTVSFIPDEEQESKVIAAATVIDACGIVDPIPVPSLVDAPEF